MQMEGRILHARTAICLIVAAALAPIPAALGLTPAALAPTSRPTRTLVVLGARKRGRGASERKGEDESKPLALKRISTALSGNRTCFVFEVDDHDWWRDSSAESNPFGAKLWPGALAAAHRLETVAPGKRVLELGAGNGFASLCCGKLYGASRVLATDVSPVAFRAVQGCFNVTST